MTKEDKIKSINKQIADIDERIECIDNHVTIESMYELTELNIKKHLLEEEIFDLENGTHRVQIIGLERRASILRNHLEQAIQRYNDSKITSDNYEITKVRIRMQLLHLKLRRLESTIEHYEELDARIMAKNRTHIL